MSPDDAQRVWTVGGALLVAIVLLSVLGGLAYISLKVFGQASQGPAAITVVLMLSFLTALSIAAAWAAEGTGKEFITLAAAGIGALAGAVTGLYGPHGGGGNGPPPPPPPPPS